MAGKKLYVSYLIYALPKVSMVCLNC